MNTESTTTQPTPCAHCPSESVALELARKLGLPEYVADRGGLHTRKSLDGKVIARATYHIPYWHALVAQSAREMRLIESRV